jgi:hypothetical protein
MVFPRHRCQERQHICCFTRPTRSTSRSLPPCFCTQAGCTSAAICSSSTVLGTTWKIGWDICRIWPSICSAEWLPALHRCGRSRLRYSKPGSQWCHCWRIGVLPGAFPLGKGANSHLHFHFLYHRDAAGDRLNRALVLVVEPRFMTLLGNSKITLRMGTCKLNFTLSFTISQQSHLSRATPCRAFQCATEYGRRGVLCACRRVCNGSADHFAAASTAAPASKYQLSLLSTSSKFKGSCRVAAIVSSISQRGG